MLCVYITTLLHYIFTIRLESISYTNVVQGDSLCDRDLWLHFLHCAIFWHKRSRKKIKKNFLGSHHRTPAFLLKYPVTP